MQDLFIFSASLLCLLPASEGSGDKVTFSREWWDRDRAQAAPAFLYNHAMVPAPSEGRQPPLLVKGYLHLQLTYG